MLIMIDTTEPISFYKTKSRYYTLWSESKVLHSVLSRYKAGVIPVSLLKR